jgi:hypothetical protein
MRGGIDRGPAEPVSILVKKESGRLHSGNNEVQIIGNKCSCGSVWCLDCYVRKGGSKRFANRLGKMDWRAVRQAVLTVDLKKFNGCGQTAYEFLRDKKAIAQFIHDLKRTGQIQIKNWVWVLEWHTDGAPHWHLFIETVAGKSGQIGNEKLLRHWDYGLVFESYIRSENHWKRFTDYFAGKGYFNPKRQSEAKDKSHQLELPEWAKDVTYRIRKTGAMIQKNNLPTKDTPSKPDKAETFVDEKPKKVSRTYREILGSCGEATICRIYLARSSAVYRKIFIPYRCYKEFPGEYIQKVGYHVCLSMADFRLFRALYDFDVSQFESSQAVA